ncbi:MAG: hypothetical protein JSV38_15235 [Desulfobacterales bacterium]|nr:MAG: hypothetical protein JSV38_15235 [Desulfobacterales bacterium]
MISKAKIAIATIFLYAIGISCTSTSVMRLEGKDFNENLPGLWEGKMYYAAGRTGPYSIKIIKIDGNKVHLTGYASGAASGTDEVSGRIENSTLILTWGVIGSSDKCKDELRMLRDDSNNLILDGPLICPGFIGKTRLNKIE